MAAFIDLTGKTINNIKFLERVENHRNGQTQWRLKCYCGAEFVAMGGDIKSKKTRSCGCSRKKHDGAGTRLYRIWKNMRQRCNNPKTPDHKHYGGRGISVCDQWDSFREFERWSLDNGYHSELTIDRKDVNGNYTPENCRWIIPSLQNRNQRKHYLNIKSQLTGVYYRKSDSKWWAEISIDNETFYLGSFETMKEANEARVKGELKYWGFTNVVTDEF